MKDDRVEFKIPAGFTLPEGNNAPGKEFDSVCTFRVKDNGEICLVMLGDTKMAGYGDKQERDSRPDYGEYAKSLGPIGEQPEPSS